MRFHTIFAVCILLAGSSALAADDVFLAGFAKAEITPSAEQIRKGEIRLGGYNLGTRAKGIADPIYARAIVLAEESGKSPLALVALDVAGISNKNIKRIQLQAEAATGIPAARVLVGSTHTHYAPDLQGLWGGTSVRYRDWAIAQAVGTIAAAHKARVPARLLASRSSADNRNRRGWDVTDTELTVIDAVSADGAKRLGTLINFGAHPVMTKDKTRVSSDFCGHLVRKVEETLGGTAVFFNGMIGDVLPARVGEVEDPVRHFGEYVADRAIAAVLGQQKTIAPARIEYASHEWNQEITNGIFVIFHLVGRLDYDLIKHDLARFSIRTRVGYLRLGQLVQGVVFPGESLARNGLPVKAAMKAEYRLWLGLTGDSLGYFVPGDEWKKGRNNNYEETVSLDQQAGDRAQKYLLKLINGGSAP